MMVDDYAEVAAKDRVAWRRRIDMAPFSTMRVGKD